MSRVQGGSLHHLGVEVIDIDSQTFYGANDGTACCGEDDRTVENSVS